MIIGIGYEPEISATREETCRLDFLALEIASTLIKACRSLVTYQTVAEVHGLPAVLASRLDAIEPPVLDGSVDPVL